MRKSLIFMVAVLIMAACARSGSSADAPTASPTETPAVTTAAATVPATASASMAPSATPVTVSTVEAVLDQDLPQSLTVTIQDLTVTIAKDLNYECKDKLERGDELILTYTGTLSENPVIVEAKKK